MAKEWTDEEVRGEIAAAIQIVREDRFDAFLRNKEQSSAGNPNSGTNPPPNPGSSDPNNGGQKPKRSLWWGETE